MLEHLPVVLAGVAMVLRIAVFLPRDIRRAKRRAKLKAVA
jgi:hypothetical protein